MFASQLLRILQTIPSDVKNETCVSDSAEQDMTMKEIYQSNSLRRSTDPLEFEVKGRDECWKPKFVDDFSTDNQNGTRDSTVEEFQNGFLCRPSCLEEDTDSLSSYTNAKDNMQNSPEHEQFTDFNEKESNDSRLPYIADKNVLECETPELIVCYKDINYHVVKDICVDQEMPVKNEVLIQSSEGDQSSHSSTELLAQENPKLPSESSSDQDIAEHFGPENSMQKGEKNYGTRSFLRSFLKSLDGVGNEVPRLPDQISSTKAAPEAGPKEDVQTSSLYYNSKVENGTITFNFNSPAPVVTDENVHDQSPNQKNENSINSDNQTVKDSSNDSVGSQGKYDQGELSFSAAGLITYSGPIAYSGSVSFRSDGSATSGRSFAFPILQSEWTNSPVRMTKADGRDFRKHKGWRSGLLCCRF